MSAIRSHARACQSKVVGGQDMKRLIGASVQIHLSTMVVLVIQVSLFVGANITPRFEGSRITIPTTGLIPEDLIAGYVHGWPFTAYKAYYPSTEPGSAYSFQPGKWFWTNALMNAVAGIGSVLLVFIVLEWRIASAEALTDDS